MLWCEKRRMRRSYEEVMEEVRGMRSDGGQSEDVRMIGPRRQNSNAVSVFDARLL